MKAIDKPACHNALDTLMPAFATHHNHAATGVGLLNARHGIIGKRRLNVATLLVDLFQLSRKASCLNGIPRKKQIKRQRRIGHATRRVKTRNERERERVSRDRGQICFGHRRKRHISRACGGTHLRNAVGHKRTVFGRKRHHVAHRAERCDLGVRAPKRWHAPAPS